MLYFLRFYWFYPVLLYRSVIALHMLTMQQKAFRTLTPNEGHNYISTDATMDPVRAAEVVLQVLKSRDCVDPVRVLGMRCHSQMSLWIISSLLIGTIAVVQFAAFGYTSAI